MALYGSVESNKDFADDESEDPLLTPEELRDRAQYFSVAYDPERAYRATEINLFSFAKPHMRAFHGSWICYFVSMFVQFSMAPLLPELQKSLSLTKAEIWTSNIWSMVGGVPNCFMLGPLSDKYGARLIVTTMLALIAIPAAFSGFITTLAGLLWVRFIVGAFDNFVPSQHWVTLFFVSDVSGTAMSISSGLGAMGSSAAQFVVGSMLFPLCVFLTKESDLAWRIALIFPSFISLATAFFFFYKSDDSPLGNFHEVKGAGLMIERSAIDSFRAGALNLNSWILFLQFAGSCGVDLTMCNGAALYYHDRYNLSTAASGAVAGLYGISAVFARGFGGTISDWLFQKFSLRGRLLAQMLSMIGQGALILVFAQQEDIRWSILFMIAFSILVQISISTCYAVVPYVDGRATGTIAGIVGAGGNVGAIILGDRFRRDTSYRDSTIFMGWFVVALALLTPLVAVKGYRGLLFGKDDATRRQDAHLIVPAK